MQDWLLFLEKALCDLKSPLVSSAERYCGGDIKLGHFYSTPIKQEDSKCKLEVLSQPNEFQISNYIIQPNIAIKLPNCTEGLYT